MPKLLFMDHACWWLSRTGRQSDVPLHTPVLTNVMASSHPPFPNPTSLLDNLVVCSCRSDNVLAARISHAPAEPCPVASFLISLPVLEANTLCIVYAIHLTNLVPLNVSTHRPHASVIQGFLDRAELPEEIVAFSACVLDALTSRFASTWRDALAPADQTSDCHDFRRLDPRQTLHVSPDIIVLAALSLAHGFLVDRMRSTRHWSIKESRGAFSVRDIEATKRAMLQDMDYGLWRISNDTLQRRLKNMQRAKTLPAHTCTPSTTLAKDRRRNVSLSLQGAAIWQYGVQTPEPSP